MKLPDKRNCSNNDVEHSCHEHASAQHNRYFIHALAKAGGGCDLMASQITSRTSMAAATAPMVTSDIAVVAAMCTVFHFF
jgi:hypothetical protein